MPKSEGGECLSGRVSRSDELHTLAARCEREAPSSSLDFAIFEATHANSAPAGTFEEWVAPAYTTSLDAAVTLVPEGFVWAADNLSGPRAHVLGGENDAGDVPEGSSDTLGTKTVALALCAAALRARAALSKSGG